MLLLPSMMLIFVPLPILVLSSGYTDESEINWSELDREFGYISTETCKLCLWCCSPKEVVLRT
jgi:hypothetical protein